MRPWKAMGLLNGSPWEGAGSRKLLGAIPFSIYAYYTKYTAICQYIIYKLSLDNCNDLLEKNEGQNGAIIRPKFAPTWPQEQQLYPPCRTNNLRFRTNFGPFSNSTVIPNYAACETKSLRLSSRTDPRRSGCFSPSEPCAFASSGAGSLARLTCASRRANSRSMARRRRA